MSAGQQADLSIGQVAGRAGIGVDTVRFYERTGLLPAAPRTTGEHRRYQAATIDRLLFIRGAQRLGLRLAEIRDLLAVRDTGQCPCGPADAMLRQHLTGVEAEIARLTTLRADLTMMLEHMPGPCCPDPVPGVWCQPDPPGENPEGPPGENPEGR